MPRASSRAAYAWAIVTSTALWLVTAAASGKVEPWDAAAYWTVAYPLAIVLAGILGYVFPQRPWRWALAVMFTQAGVMLLGGAGLGLLPFGLVLLVVLALPAVALAALMARLRLRGTPARG